MRFLVPIGGFVDPEFGIMTTPGHKGIPLGVLSGMDWAADNQNYNDGFEASVFFPWLESMEGYREQCLFIPIPDKRGDARKTLQLFSTWRRHFDGWPVAFVAQDGQESLDFPPPDLWQVLFIGGSTGWKVGPGAARCIQRAQAIGKRIHVGRVNWWHRYEHFARMQGSGSWTCDGTRTRFDGVEKTVRAWRRYMERSRYVSGSLPGFDCAG